MNFQETLTYLYSKLPMFSRVGSAAYKANLQNITLLCEALQHPERKMKCIHIAGTNGKGSCSHMLAAILQTAGYKTALYTSPHLLDFRERIKINGEMISEDWVVKFVHEIQNLIDEIQPSFFEVTVAMAFCYFAENHVDIAIIEVGLGGLLDSTNIILPELSIITSISFDHSNLLGNSLQEIAIQKAGIIKKNIPVVIGPIQNELLPIFIDTAINQLSEYHLAPNMFEVKESNHQGSYTSYTLVNNLYNKNLHLQLELQGNYQRKNLVTVLSSIEILKERGWKILDTHIINALSNIKSLTGIRGRFEKLQNQPLVIADVAHNEEGLGEVFSQIKNMKYSDLHIVTGFVNDKDVTQLLKIFPKPAKYYFTKANIPRALPIENLREFVSNQNLHGTYFEHAIDAVHAALAKANSEDMILITGSFFILAEVLPFFDDKKHLE